MKSPVVTPQSPFRCTCNWCGVEFGASTSRASYCSLAHKKAHYRWRSKIAKYGREILTRLENLDSYMGREEEVELSTIRQLIAVDKRIHAVLKKAKVKDF